MIDHIGLAVSDLARSRAFYDAALRPLGIGLVSRIGPEESGSGGTVLGYGMRGNAFFWIGDNEAVGQGTHVAFAVESRSKVNAFFAAAVKAGGTAHGEPGPRTHYHPNYYAAFVLDPDGINVEAVCHRPE